MLFVVPNTLHVGAGPMGALEGVAQGCIYNWYEKIEPVVPRVYHKYLRKYNPFGADSIILSAEDGSADGKFVITINQELEEGNSYFYKFTDKYPQPGEDVSEWDTWDGTTEFEAESGTSICIVEADAEGKAVKAGMVVVIDEEEGEEGGGDEPEPGTLGTLTVTSVAGSTEGFTKITIAEAKQNEANQYFYKLDAALPGLEESVLTWNSWDGVAEIEAATGVIIAVVEATPEGQPVAGGTTEVVAMEAPTLGTLTVISDGSETPGYTKITVQEAKQEETNQYFYKFDEALPELNADVSSWTSWDGVSDIQAVNGHTITVVEATAEGLAVAGGMANISATLQGLTVASDAGTQVGFTKITVETEKVDPSNTYFIQVGPEESATTNMWNGTDEVELPADGTLVTVSEFNMTSGQFVAKGSTSDTVAKQKALTVSADAGTTAGTVALTVTETAEEGNTFKYALFDDVAPEHKYGQVVEATEFTSGNDVNVEGHAKVAVFEVTAENKVYGYGDATATPKELDPELGLLTVNCVAGQQIAKTAITVEPTLTEGNKYFYKVADELPSVWHQDVSDWTEWNGTDELEVEDNVSITIVEATAEGLAEKAGVGTTDCKDAISVVTEASATTVGNTVVTVYPSLTPGNKYFYKVAEQEQQITPPDVGTTVPDWTEWNGTDELAIANGEVVMIVETSAEGVVIARGYAVVNSKVQ